MQVPIKNSETPTSPIIEGRDFSPDASDLPKRSAELEGSLDGRSANLSAEEAIKAELARLESQSGSPIDTKGLKTAVTEAAAVVGDKIGDAQDSSLKLVERKAAVNHLLSELHSTDQFDPSELMESVHKRNDEASRGEATLN